MKFALTLLILITSYLNLSAQEKYVLTIKQQHALYKKTQAKLLKEYKYDEKTDLNDKQVIQKSLLNKKVKTIFNQLVFSNDNLVNNASAFGYSQNEKKTSLSVNTNFDVSYGDRLILLKVGVSAVGKGSAFNLYSNESWNNSSGISLGGIIKLVGAGVFIKPGYTNKKFAQDKKARTIKSDNIIRNKENYSQTEIDNLQKIVNDLSQNYTKENVLKTHLIILAKYPAIKKLITEDNFSEAFIKLETKISNIKKFRAIEGDSAEFEKLIRKSFYNFDSINDPTKGYSIKWLDINVNLNNSNYKFTDETINAEIKPPFDEERSTNNLLVKTSINANYSRNDAYRIIYGQIGAGFQSGSFLDSNLIFGTPKINLYESDNYLIVDENDQVLGSYNEIRNNLEIYDFHAYGAILFSKSKNFGLNATFSHRFLGKRPDLTEYKNNFTALVGPVFRTVKGDKAGVTFGLDIGYDNAIYGEKTNDFFTARLRIGIPFNIYTKKEAK